MFKTLQWEDWAGVALGAWLLASPWALGYVDNPIAAMNALVMGSILVVEEFFELGAHETAGEWIDMAAGAWLVVSPIVLGFGSSTAAAANTAAVGFLTLLLAACAVSPLDRRIAEWWRDFAVG